MKKIVLLVTMACGHFGFKASAQINILVTDNAANQVILGNYNPATYLATTILDDPDTISKGINTRVSADSMHTYLNELNAFQNRNTGSDTVSNTKGIGAARRWALAKFQQFSTQNESRLLPAYLQFDGVMCSVNQHRDIIAVLPGTDTSDKSVIVVEGHIDSRCSGLCDTACQADGMEDNGSGTALVLELARVMSKYSYKRTIIFMLCIGEEQGLYGAKALAVYLHDNNVPVHAVLNNDVIGGIFCGHTSSPPSCPGFADIDSTHVRLFSYGGFNSPHKQLSRFIKLEYKEMILPVAAVPMGINIMTNEDRSGRGGDHIPFREIGFTAMRFTAANENGDADVTNPNYIDRQHTSADILGLDLNADNILDSFFVDFDYLARNTVINGNAAGMAGIGPLTPDFTLSSAGNSLTINITQQQQYLNYRVAVRTTTNDWDSVYTFTGATSYTIDNISPVAHIVSVASVDNKGVESLFSEELIAFPVNVKEVSAAKQDIELMQNTPNPTDEATMISVMVRRPIANKDAYISIRDIAGREVKKLQIVLKEGINEVIYDHGYNMSGIYTYTLVVDGKSTATKKMIFTN